MAKTKPKPVQPSSEPRAESASGPRVEMWPIDRPKPYERNPRRNDAAVEKVAASIREFGWDSAIVVDRDGVIIAGHTRLKAAKRLGLAEVPVIVRADLTPEQARALRLADNKTGEFAEWDEALLGEELAALAEAQVDMEQFGFDLSAPGTEGQTDEDAVPEPPPEPVSRRGAVYALGRHRLMCGDSTSAEDVARLMNGERAELLFTSPPYSDMRAYNGGKDLSVVSLARFIPTYEPFANYQCVNLGLQVKDGEIVQYWDAYIATAKECGYKLMGWNVWDKLTTGAISNQVDFITPTRHEWIFVFGKAFKNINRTWEKKPESVIKGDVVKKIRGNDDDFHCATTGDHSRPYKKMESVLSLMSEHGDIRSAHPAVFPVALPVEYINAFTNESESVIEPFGGSGTTMIAAEKSNRRCYMMELDPHYCDVIRKRWAEFVHGEGCDWQTLAPEVDA